MIQQKQNFIGVMQGRLLPKYLGRYQAHPKGYWQDEFQVAAKLKLDCIEFILDYEDAKENPLLSTGGLEEIMKLTEISKVSVKTVCADYFMQAPLHDLDSKVSELSISILKELKVNGSKIDIMDIVIPCVDQSSLKDIEAQDRLVEKLIPLQELAEKLQINLSLETDLAPIPFKQLLERFQSKRITVNYDLGNSASFGYDTIEEFGNYGDRISDIHIKDRKLGGSSVVLGSGDANFSRFFTALSKINYKGPFIMQAYRDEEGIEVFTKQLHWFKSFLSKTL
jgi:L-ribulose-5-phosphate 3-epimerase